MFMEADPEYRKQLRLDMSSMDQALRNGEWKAATVLAGSLLEALLLWAIGKKEPAAVSAAISALKAEKKVSDKLGDDPTTWHLPHYLQVAEHLQLIKGNTVSSCAIAKDFRNLIHPGREIRLKQKCNRGTALSAVAAVEHVVSDLALSEPNGRP